MSCCRQRKVYRGNYDDGTAADGAANEGKQQNDTVRSRCEAGQKRTARKDSKRVAEELKHGDFWSIGRRSAILVATEQRRHENKHKTKPIERGAQEASSARRKQEANSMFLQSIRQVISSLRRGRLEVERQTQPELTHTH